MVLFVLSAPLESALPPSSAPTKSNKIAIIGAGITGLSLAWLLRDRYDVTLFEAAHYAGGHANTVDLPLPSSAQAVGQAPSTLPVDTGFIVYNQRTYPNLTALFNQLQVPTQASDMSFAVSLRDNINPRRNLEYSSHPRALLGQWRNWCQAGYAGMLRDLLRLYRLAPQDATDPRFAEMTLGQYVAARGFGQRLLTDHLIPMTAAIWSMPAASTLDFPLPSFMRFCLNHGLLQLRDRPAWRTVTGGSRVYVQRLLADCPRLNLRLNQPVQRVMRLEQGVQIMTESGPELFDQVVFAVHGAQILPLLTNPSGREQAVLAAFRTQANQAILHHDPRLMPRRRLAWAAWNVLAPYRIDAAALKVPTQGDSPAEGVCVTYWMNRLQNLATPAGMAPVLLTLNPIVPPRAELVRGQWCYHHPIMDQAAIAAQAMLPSIQGVDRLWFGGAWAGYGFHEDGLNAALAIANQLGVTAPWQVENH